MNNYPKEDASPKEFREWWKWYDSKIHYWISGLDFDLYRTCWGHLCTGGYVHFPDKCSKCTSDWNLVTCENCIELRKSED
jgi:hypothetical protein